MKTEFKFGPVLFGSLTMLMVELILAAICGGLVLSGLFSANAMPVMACVGAVLACFCGGNLAAKKCSSLRLPVALVSAVLFLLVIYVLRGCIFGTVGDRPWRMVLSAVFGAFCGVLPGTGNVKKRRR